MALSSLQSRLGEAGLTPEEFAAIVGVDPKTVQRWLLGRVPYRRHRATIARALDTSEHELWPDDVSAPAASSEDAGPAGSGDVVASWGGAGQDGAPDLGELLVPGAGAVDVLDAGRRLLVDDRLIAGLIETAGPSSPVRVLVDLPGRELRPLIGVAHLDLRVIDDAGGPALIRAGDRMLVYLDLPGRVDQAPPLLELHDSSEDGLFARYIDHFADLWGQAPEPLQSDEQLESYLLLEAGDEDDEDSDPLWPLAPTEPAQRAESAAPTAETGAHPPRRWPRRPR